MKKACATKPSRQSHQYGNNEKLRAIDVNNILGGEWQDIVNDPSETFIPETETAPHHLSVEDIIIPDDDDLVEVAPGDIEDFLSRITDTQGDIFNLKHVKHSSEKPDAVDYVAQRVQCLNFHEYEPLFEEVNLQIKSGIREAIPFRKESEIEKGQFFILNGIMAYIADVGEEFERNGKKNARMKVIFSNGTEGDNLKRSLATELYKDEQGRRITDPRTRGLFSNNANEEDIGTGTVYVLQSLSTHRRIEPIRNYIHKIGVTRGSVKTRIANAENDPTYLLAGVKVVAEFKVYNVKASKIEKLLQTYFDRARADITIEDRFGKPVRSTEWFFVLPQTIKEAVNRLIDGSLGESYYDPKQAKIRMMNEKD
ncbi:MAG: GIY-YIG nuclease family protein [Roseivirga sp.]|nr:GIY-YIG nuclease family protein [Roseivirga sp.]